MLTTPAFESYDQYSSANYGAHSLRFIDAEGNSFWFSYQTLVAFKPVSEPKVVHSNEWGPTTGKHLNRIDGGGKDVKSDRLCRSDFAIALQAAFPNA